MKQPRSASEVGRYRTSNGVLCRSPDPMILWRCHVDDSLMSRRYFAQLSLADASRPILVAAPFFKVCARRSSGWRSTFCCRKSTPISRALGATQTRARPGIILSCAQSVTRSAHGTRTSSMAESQRRPLAGLDQQEQQSARDRARRPCCAIEEAVKGAEVGIVIAVPRYVAPP